MNDYHACHFINEVDEWQSLQFTIIRQALSSTCIAWQFGNDTVLLHSRFLADHMTRLCNYVIDYKCGIFHWLFAIPLLHFLSEAAVPFSGQGLTAVPSSLSDNAWWGAEDLSDLRRVRREGSSSRSEFLQGSSLEDAIDWSSRGVI